MSVHATTDRRAWLYAWGGNGDSHEVHSSRNADYGFDRSFARSFSAEQHGLFGHQLEPGHKRVERPNNGRDHPAPKEAHDQPQAKETHSELQPAAPCQSDELQSEHDWLGQQFSKAREE